MATTTAASAACCGAFWWKATSRGWFNKSIRPASGVRFQIRARPARLEQRPEAFVSRADKRVELQICRPVVGFGRVQHRRRRWRRGDPLVGGRGEKIALRLAQCGELSVEITKTRRRDDLSADIGCLAEPDQPQQG